MRTHIAAVHLRLSTTLPSTVHYHKPSEVSGPLPNGGFYAPIAASVVKRMVAMEARKISRAEIARQLGVCQATIYNKLGPKAGWRGPGSKRR